MRFKVLAWLTAAALLLTLVGLFGFGGREVQYPLLGLWCFLVLAWWFVND